MDKIEEISNKIIYLEKLLQERKLEYDDKLKQRYSEIEVIGEDAYIDEEYNDIFRKSQYDLEKIQQKIDVLYKKLELLDNVENNVGNAKEKYDSLVENRKFLKEQISKDEKIIKESQLWQKREGLKQEIERLLKLGKSDDYIEIREYKSDIEKISKELAKIEERIKEQQVKLLKLEEEIKKYDIQEEKTDNEEIIQIASENISDDEYNDLTSIISSNLIKEREKCKIHYEVTNKGIVYNGFYQDENELYEYIQHKKMNKKLEKILENCQIETFKQNADPYLIAAILNNDDYFLNEEQNRTIMEDNLKSYYNFIINGVNDGKIDIKYDLRRMSIISKIKNECNLKFDFISEIKKIAYRNRNIADIEGDSLLKLYFRIKKVIERMNVRQKQRNVMALPQSTKKREYNNNWKVAEKKYYIKRVPNAVKAKREEAR